MSHEPLSNYGIILYQMEDGRTCIQCRFENKTVWLTQKLMAELFGKDVRTIHERIQNVFAEGELVEDSVIRNFRITAAHDKDGEDAGKVTAEIAQDRLFESDFDRMLKEQPERSEETHAETRRTRRKKP